MFFLQSKKDIAMKREGIAKKQDNSKVEFFAIVETSRSEGRKTIYERKPAYVPLDQSVSSGLAAQFKAMADTFFEDNPTVIPFDGRYTPGKGETFLIENFSAEASIVAAASNPFGTPPLNLSRSPFPQIKAIIMTELNSPLRILFQEFKTSQIIRQGRAFFFGFKGSDTYDELDVSGIAIGNQIDAVYDDGKFWFRSYYTANRFADLAEHFHDATNEEIKELLKMDGIVAENEAELLAHTDAGMRRKFTIIRDTEILSLVTPEEIRQNALSYNLDIEIDSTDGQKRIVIPSDKAAAKEVLDFLCQARFFGSLTREPFVANSFRPYGNGKTATVGGPTSAGSRSTKKAVKKKAAKKSARK